MWRMGYRLRAGGSAAPRPDHAVHVVVLPAARHTPSHIFTRSRTGKCRRFRHWAIDSDATVKLITSSVRAIKRLPRIGRAMLAMIDRGKPYERHPSYWEPFILVGEGGVAAR
jgi:hypothetical protein